MQVLPSEEIHQGLESKNSLAVLILAFMFFQFYDSKVFIILENVFIFSEYIP